MLCGLGENPPAASVDSALQTASNTGMPAIINNAIKTNVKNV